MAGQRFRVSTAGGLQAKSFTLLPSAVEAASLLVARGYPAFIKSELKVVELKKAATGGGSRRRRPRRRALGRPGALPRRAGRSVSWFVAFFGTCVAMFEADNLAEARKKAYAELGQVTSVREARSRDIDWWLEAGGPQLTNDDFDEEDWAEL